MPVRHLEAFFRPRTVALVTEESAAPARAHVLIRNLFDGGFAGPILPVSATAGAVEGVLAYPSLAALPLAPELCVVLAPAARLGALIVEAAERGAHAVLALRDEAAGAADESWRQQARRAGVRLLGPGSLGVMAPQIGLNASLAASPARPGRLALVSTSGSVVDAILDWAYDRGIGFSAVATTGGADEVSVGDLLDHLAMDVGTRAILLHVDDVRDARGFLSAARAAARNKPVIAYRPGRHDAADAAWDGAFRRAGMLRVGTLGDLFGAAETLALARPAPSPRVLVVGNGAGLCMAAADAVLGAGAELARPTDAMAARLRALEPPPRSLAPLDLGPEAGGSRYGEAIKILAGDRGGDALLVLHGPAAAASPLDAAEAVVEIAAGTARCVLTCWLGERSAHAARILFAERHLPTYPTPAEAIRGLLQIMEYRRNQQALTETPPSVPADFDPRPETARAVIDAALAAGRDQLSEDELDMLLGAFALAPRHAASPAALPVRLEEDGRFGPVLRLGTPPGTVALPPLNLHLAADALTQAGTAGDGMAAALVKLAQILVDLPELASLDGARLRADGTLAIGGAIAHIRRWTGDAAARLAIRPYPRQLEAPLTLPDGRALLVRPVLPEDEPALEAMFAHLTPEAVRLRFFAPRRELGHQTAARLTQLDYGREMGFVVAGPQRPGAAPVYGIAHLSCDADRERGEFAIMVASDMEGLGLGPLLMRRVLDHAAATGVREVFGEVLRENAPMLRLCAALGFDSKASADDPELMRVSRAVAA